MELLRGTQAQLQKIDEQILDLLEERADICANSEEDSERTIEYWLDNAMDREMNEVGIEKFCKVLMAYCRKSGQ